MITLSGGNFGGEVVNEPHEPDEIIERTDESGTWLYRVSLDGKSAVFEGMK